MVAIESTNEFLPEIYNLPFVTTKNFNIDNVTIVKNNSEKSGMYTFMYNYDNKKSPSELRLTIPRNVDSYFECSKIRESTYKNNFTGYNIKVKIDTDNEDQNDFAAIINQCCEKYNNEYKKLKLPFSKEKNSDAICIYPSIMYDKTTKEIFTPFYNGKEQMFPNTITDFVGRIAVSFQVTEKNFKLTLVQCHVEKMTPNFPLSIID
jgi:hypothetical protein